MVFSGITYQRCPKNLLGVTRRSMKHSELEDRGWREVEEPGAGLLNLYNDVVVLGITNQRCPKNVLGVTRRSIKHWELKDRPSKCSAIQRKRGLLRVPPPKPYSLIHPYGSKPSHTPQSKKIKYSQTLGKSFNPRLNKINLIKVFLWLEYEHELRLGWKYFDYESKHKRAWSQIIIEWYI